MTQEEKQILLKDLCARLPYGVKICVDGYICTLLDINTEMGDKLNGETFHTLGFNKPDGDYDFCTISEVKPYLRPMSSMTEEEKKEHDFYCGYKPYDENTGESYLTEYDMQDYIDFLYEHHLDFHGLIPMGLALEAPEGMYNSISE